MLRAHRIRNDIDEEKRNQGPEGFKICGIDDIPRLSLGRDHARVFQ